MIQSQDRSGWIGASDTSMVMGNWGTQTFAKWWLEKLGILHFDFATPAMKVGTAYEHKILDYLGVATRDRQIRRRSIRLRVNLDGEDDNLITEVKTHKGEFKVTRPYWQQCQVEMFATKKECRIAAYNVTDDEYVNYFLPIDPDRLTFHPIEYDEAWIKTMYLPRLRVLAKCLKRKTTPHKYTE